MRQDMLALQLMQIMKNVWVGLGIPVKVFPYRSVNLFISTKIITELLLPLQDAVL